MQSLIVLPVLLLGLAQQAPVLEPPRYIPPPPKPAVVKPVPIRTPIVQSLLLIPPAPASQFWLPQPVDTTLPQPHPVHYYAARQLKSIKEATRANLKNENRPGLTLFVYQAKHIPAKQLAHSLGRKFAWNHVIKASHQQITTNVPLVIIPEEKTGLLLITTATWNVDEIKRLISETDREPKQFQIHAIIKITGSDGKQQIVASPQIRTIEGQLATIQISEPDGSSLELQIKVRELTPPLQTSPSIKKASAEKIYLPPMTAVPTPVSYRLISRKPSSAKVNRALNASYQAIQQLRIKHVQHRSTQEREKEIQQALEKQISLHFEEARLIDVLKYIRKSAGINIALDNLGLEEEGLTSDTKVSIDVTEIRLKSALNVLLRPRRLAYMIEDEVLKITSESRVHEPLETVHYPVADLTVASSPNHAAISSKILVNLITSLVEPNSWSERWGRGAIQVIMNDETTHSLVIRQTDQRHEKIRKLLDSLRKLNRVGEEKEELLDSLRNVKKEDSAPKKE